MPDRPPNKAAENRQCSLSKHILLADAHPVVLMGARTALTAGRNYHCSRIAQASDADQLLRHLHSQPCDLLITDYSMPYSRFPDGLPLLSHIRRHFPRLLVIVMTMINSPMVLRPLLKLGVRGLVDKHGPLSELNLSVDRVVSGQRYVSPSFSKLFEAQPLTALSDRELEVVRLFGQKLSGREIAVRLSRSEKTISRHKRMAMDKLGVRHDSELVDYARRLGFG